MTLDTELWDLILKFRNTWLCDSREAEGLPGEPAQGPCFKGCQQVGYQGHHRAPALNHQAGPCWVPESSPELPAPYILAFSRTHLALGGKHGKGPFSWSLEWRPGALAAVQKWFQCYSRLRWAVGTSQEAPLATQN